LVVAVHQVLLALLHPLTQAAQPVEAEAEAVQADQVAVVYLQPLHKD
jgi:hypothetical protein